MPRWAVVTCLLLSIGVARATHAQANPFVGAWQGALTKLIVLSDGRAFGQQVSAGILYTSYGAYSFEGDRLIVKFSSVRPGLQCATSIGADGYAQMRCLPAVPLPTLAYRFRFEGPNALLLGVGLLRPAEGLRAMTTGQLWR